MQLPIQAQPIRRKVSRAKINSQRIGVTQSQERLNIWGCYLHSDNSLQGELQLGGWSLMPGNAEWACNNWLSNCANNGGCYARPL